MSQCFSHSRQQFAHSERFADSVVGSQVEHFDLLALPLIRRHDDYWDVGPLSHLFNDLLAVTIREAGLKQSQVGGISCNVFKAIGDRFST